MDFSSGGKRVIERLVEAYGFSTRQALCDHRACPRALWLLATCGTFSCRLGFAMRNRDRKFARVAIIW